MISADRAFLELFIVFLKGLDPLEQIGKPNSKIKINRDFWSEKVDFWLKKIAGGLIRSPSDPAEAGKIEDRAKKCSISAVRRS